MYVVLQPMEIGNPLMFIVYVDSALQILFLWAHFFYKGHPAGFRGTSHSGFRQCCIAAGVSKLKAANNRISNHHLDISG